MPDETGAIPPETGQRTLSQQESGVTRWRKKPVVIEARQYVDGPGGGNRQELAQWCGGDWTARHRPTETPGVDTVVLVIMIPTLEGVMETDPGDWIIRGVKGEFYPCKPEIFDASYEPADAPGDGMVAVSREDLRTLFTKLGGAWFFRESTPAREAEERLRAAAGDPQ